MFRTISLDAGGVLVRPNWHRIAAACAVHGVSVNVDLLREHELPVMRELDTAFEVGRTSDSDRLSSFFLRVLERAQVQAPPESIAAAIAELRRIHGNDNLWDEVFEDVPPALARFEALGLTMVVLSNANGTVRSKLERLGLCHWFAAVVDSGEEAVEKPDPRFFSLGLERIQADPALTLHVGDLYHVDVVGARAAGLHAVLIDRAGLHSDRDCTRFADLGALATALEQGRLTPESVIR